MQEVKPNKIKIFKNGLQERYYYKKVIMFCKTNGSGYWSRKLVLVKHKLIELISRSWQGVWPENHFSLNVYFEKDCWSVCEDGLIYTDESWLNDLKENFNKLGFEHTDKICYSEQGMQGNDYVNLDIQESFAKEFFELLYKEKNSKLCNFVNSEIFYE